MMASRRASILNIEPASSPPSSHPHLNRRFWFQSDLVTLEGFFETGPVKIDRDITVEDNREEVLRLTGTSRKSKVKDDEWEVEVVVEQVEVVLDESRFCQRCAYCGAWENADGEARFVKVGKDGEDDIYWCGVSPSIPIP